MRSSDVAYPGLRSCVLCLHECSSARSSQRVWGAGTGLEPSLGHGRRRSLQWLPARVMFDLPRWHIPSGAAAAQTPATSMPRDAERITYELDYMFGQLVTKHNPAPLPSGHPLLSGTSPFADNNQNSGGPAGYWRKNARVRTEHVLGSRAFTRVDNALRRPLVCARTQDRRDDCHAMAQEVRVLKRLVAAVHPVQKPIQDVRQRPPRGTASHGARGEVGATVGKCERSAAVVCLASDLEGGIAF